MKAIGLLGFFLLLSYTTDASLLDPVIENVRHIKASHPPDKLSGMWKKKMLWKPRWVKEWKSSNVLKPVWKKFWGPVIIREWVPIPKPPPQWDGVHVGPAEPPGAPFLDVGEPPAPNFSYLSKTPTSYVSTKPASHGSSVLGSFSSGSQNSYQVPHLPISVGFKSQAETYSGQPSYGSNFDSSSYDLNPPVEQFNSKYSYGSSSNRDVHRPPPSLPPVKPVVSHSPKPHSHNHHHHHHHRVKSNGHTHPSSRPDLTKFPPDWNSWKSVVSQPRPHSSGLAQATSVVSKVVSSTTARPDEVVNNHLLSQGLLPADNDFIQAALVGEYHYTEHATQSPSPVNPPLLSSYDSHPIPSHGPNRTDSNPAVSGHLKDSSRPLPPRPSPVHPASSSRPSLNSSSPSAHSPAPARPHPVPQTPPVHHIPNPKPPHNPKPAPPHVPFPIPSQIPTHAPPRPNHVKLSTSGSSHAPVPAAPHRPAPVHHPPTTTHPRPSPSGPLRNPAPVQPVKTPIRAHAPPQVPHDQRKPSPVIPQTPNGPVPSHQIPQPRQKTSPPKPEPPKDHKLIANKPELLNIPDFKALPSASVEAFHFIEGFPSNQTLSKAALIGNLGNHPNENQVEIIGTRPNQKEVPPYVAKLAQAIVNEHLKRTEKAKFETTTEKITEKPNVVTSTEQTTREAPTERPTVTIVYPSTNPFVRKTLKDYLEEENSGEKSTKVFVVTPIPNLESSTVDNNGV